MALEFPDKADELLRIVESNYQETLPLHTEQQRKIDLWLRSYNMEAYNNETEGKTTLVAPTTKKHLDSQVAPIKAPFLDTKKIARTNATTGNPESIKLANMFQNFLNFTWNKRIPSNRFVEDIVRTLLHTGSTVIRHNWEYKAVNKYQAKKRLRKVKEKVNNSNYKEVEKPGDTTIEKEVNVTEVDKETKYFINEPSGKVLQHNEVYIAPNTDGPLSEADYVIQEYITNFSALQENGGYSNLDQVQFIDISVTNSFSANTVPNQTRINYTDIGSKQIRIKEYWGYFDINDDGINEPIVCTIANDMTVIKLELNPFPDGKLPFELVTISKGLYSLYGQSDAEYLSVIQKIQTSILRGGLDNVSRVNAGQRGIPLNMIPNSKELKNYYAGKDYFYDAKRGSPGMIINETYNELPGTFYNLLDKFDKEAEVVTGVSPTSGQSTGPGSMAQPNSSMSSVQLRQLDIVRSIAMDGLLPMFRRWILYASEFMSPAEWGRIVGDENVTEIPDDLDLFDLVDIEIDITTYELNKSKLDNLSFLLQTSIQTLPPELQNMLIAKMFDIANFTAEADTMRNYQPEPDPAQQEAQQIEIEMMKAELAVKQKEIKYKESQTQENFADVRKKLGDAASKEASAERTKIQFLNELRGLPTQERSAKHFADLASKERINLQKLKTKQYEIDRKVEIERAKLLSRDKDVERKTLDARRFRNDDLEYRYFKTEVDHQTKLDIMSRNNKGS